MKVRKVRREKHKEEEAQGMMSQSRYGDIGIKFENITWITV